MAELLKISNLTVSFESPAGSMTAVKHADLEISPGETLALVGESGCGKTVLCKSMLGLLCSRGRIGSGGIKFGGDELSVLSEKDMVKYRGGDIAMIFQDPMTSLDPAFSVGEQIAEVLRMHEGLGRKAARDEAVKLMESVKIPDAAARYKQRPYQFSGGMRQRIAIAAALAGRPRLILADEPTTALDEQTRMEIMKLLKSAVSRTQCAMLFITHDLSLVEGIAQRVAVMKDGEIVETGRVEDVFASPQHEYTAKLLGYLDYSRGRGHDHREKDVSGEILLSVKNLCKSYAAGSKKNHVVLDGFSLEIKEGEIAGLVGRSGCGKSTLCRCIMGLEKFDSGEIFIRDDAGIQMIFQDTGSCFNERMTVEQIIEEPLVIKKGRRGMRRRAAVSKQCSDQDTHGTGGLSHAKRREAETGACFQDDDSGMSKESSRAECRKSESAGGFQGAGVRIPEGLSRAKRREALSEAVRSVMAAVELDPALAQRKAYELSGGQRQRVAIARALITDPDLIIADEPLTGLDVTAQAQIVHLFKRLSHERGLAVLFIAHDLPMVNHISSRVIEMKPAAVNID